MERQDRGQVSAQKQSAWLTKPLGPERAQQGQPSRSTRCPLSQYSGAKSWVDGDNAQSLADHCVLEEGGLESHAFIYLISKTAVPPTLVFRIMGHYALSAIKRMHLYDDITPLCSQGWRISSRTANNNCWGDVCEAQTWRRRWTEIVCGLWASPDLVMANSGLLMPHCIIALQGCSPRASIRESLVCVSAPTPLWATAVLPNAHTPPHPHPPCPHWHHGSSTDPAGVYAYHCCAQPGGTWLSRVCDIQINNSSGYVLSFFSGLFEVSLLCAILFCS